MRGARAVRSLLLAAWHSSWGTSASRTRVSTVIMSLPGGPTTCPQVTEPFLWPSSPQSPLLPGHTCASGVETLQAVSVHICMSMRPYPCVCVCMRARVFVCVCVVVCECGCVYALACVCSRVHAFLLLCVCVFMLVRVGAREASILEPLRSSLCSGPQVCLSVT